MANWAYVEDGVAVELHDNLPQNWRNVSNFFALANEPELLRNLSWYPVTVTTQPITDNLRQRYGETTYTFDAEQQVVVQHTEVVSNGLSDEDIFVAQRSTFMDYLRRERNDLLSKSDWTQAADVQEIKSDEWKEAWKSYRQQLRDLPGYYDVNYPTEINTGAIQFPQLPQV